MIELSDDEMTVVKAIISAWADTEQGQQVGYGMTREKLEATMLDLILKQYLVIKQTGGGKFQIVPTLRARLALR